MCETEASLNEAHCFHGVCSWWHGLDQFSLTTGSFFYPSVLQPNRGNELNSLLTSQCKSLCLYPFPTPSPRLIYSIWDYYSFSLYFFSFLPQKEKDKLGDCGIFLMLCHSASKSDISQVNTPVMQRGPIKCMVMGKNRYGEP